LLIDGDSGSGKTTLLTSLARELINRRYGEFSFIPQYPNIFTGSVEENIIFFRKSVDAFTLRKVLDKVGLSHINPDFILRSGGEPLSGGERQRLVLARALLTTRTNLIIIDEGFSALDDERAKESLKQVLQSYKRIVFTAHGSSLKDFATEKLQLT
jgi:ABC-type transport system involved in cytochrome bd biosynthesis fused ATPase/permease subunit